MPDASRPPRPSPGSWAEAFAALPQETPPAGRWADVSTHLEAHRPGRMLPAWLGLAAAAAVVLAVVIPRDTQEPQTGPAAPAVATTRPNPAPSMSPPVAGADEVTSPAPGARQSADLAEAPAAAAATTPRTTAVPGAKSTTLPDTEPDARIARLYQESAQLEALLALARDQRVGSGGALLLADAFDARIAGIDAVLANADLEAAERQLLWEARVDALRQAAGFVSTQRLLAVEGHGDAWLVSVD